MTRIERLRDDVLRAIAHLPAELVPLDAAAGRWLAGPALARLAAPPEDCSAMDGYAVRAGEAGGGEWQPVVRTVFAGAAVPEPLAPAEAVRIFTGAPLPPGADVVVRQEMAVAEEGRVRFRAPPQPGEHVRRAGEDVLAGGEVLTGGVRLGPRQRALCAAVGCLEVKVARRPRVALVLTGDEIVRGAIPDSNGVALAGLLASLGAEVTSLAVGDEAPAVERALAGALCGADAVVTVGGVSVGVRDHVPAALASLGAEVRLHGVPMKPGKPFLFALVGGKPVLGLPGSPSACLVAFEVFARPALLHLAGARQLFRRALRLPASAPFEGRAERARFLWASVGDDGRVAPIGHDAAQVRGPALADALVHLPEGVRGCAEGDLVETWLLDDGADAR